MWLPASSNCHEFRPVRMAARDGAHLELQV